MNTKGPTATDLAGSHRKPQVFTALASVATGAPGTGTVVTAPGAGFRIVVVGAVVSGGNATGGAVGLYSGAGGTKLWEHFLAITAPIVDNPPGGMSVCACAENALLELANASGANAYVTVRYIIEAVV